MTNAEQMALMKKVQAKWPLWNLQAVNGYVHGVSDEDLRATPKKNDDLPDSALYRGAYLAGFCDARGEDVSLLGISTGTLQYRWWVG
ncbi:MAG: hypothetical protein NTW96_27680 [Planctomycetia bacterium]|nr:hypothetical protein [Planctomycetia bacterium]